ncbi:hypothetical protein IE53DRAFT_161273 [Violaceomyces palustris]|uniref:Uncharacterized protein n=1 Tax=Violaceomyces palustris TaxID=1673888 RepID=A0ACD0P5T2_9BASI|nr:hypothetical protein IE53DRAFT_161273 [Violaceomyces palustris]
MNVFKVTAPKSEAGMDGSWLSSPEPLNSPFSEITRKNKGEAENHGSACMDCESHRGPSAMHCSPPKKERLRPTRSIHILRYSRGTLDTCERTKDGWEGARSHLGFNLNRELKRDFALPTLSPSAPPTWISVQSSHRCSDDRIASERRAVCATNFESKTT